MKEFLKGQFDYIYFFYGLSAFIIAVASFVIGIGKDTDKEKLPKIGWILLGMFGLSHGIAQWLDMLMVVYSGNDVLPIFNLCALGISYLCLFEFARISFFLLRKKNISRWYYFLIIVFLPLGYKLGLNGWLIMVRYYLGFPALYFTARMVHEFSKKEKENKRLLTCLSAMFGLYAVFAGLIVPKAAFLPASFLNFESFYNVFGVPSQLISAALLFFMAMAIWFYSFSPSEAAYTPPKYHVHFMPAKWMIAFVLMVFICVGWIFTNRLDYYAGIQVIKKSKPRTDSALNRLTRELSILGNTAYAMSRVSAIRLAVSGPESQNIKKAETVLAHFKTKFGAIDCVLLDAQGVAIASAEKNSPEIGIGKSYASMSYFKDAFSWDNGYYFKLGSVYNERIYYVSYVVKNTADKIGGVVVIIKKIYAEPLFQYRFFSIAITFLISCLAMIFFLALRRRETFIRLIEKAHAQLEEVDRMKTDFISVVSHELRTPLTSIGNAAGILMKGGPDKRVVDDREKELLGIIIDNVGRQTRMVNDLLDVSKIEAGVMQVFPKPVNLPGLIENATALLKPLIETKKLDLVFDLKMHNKKVWADPDLVVRIVNNLVVNAIKFTPAGGRITIKTEEANREAKVTVLDTGIGISKADQEKLFDKFYRSSCIAAKEKRGCGLGLAIAKGLVEAQKGKIWVDSELEKGSSFYFTLPLAGQNIYEEKNTGSR